MALRCGRIKAAVRAMTCSALARSSLSSSSTPTAPHHPIRTSSSSVEDLRSWIGLGLCCEGCGVLLSELGEHLAVAEAVADQLVVGPLGNDPPTIEQDDALGKHDRRDAGRN